MGAAVKLSPGLVLIAGIALSPICIAAQILLPASSHWVQVLRASVAGTLSAPGSSPCSAQTRPVSRLASAQHCPARQRLVPCPEHMPSAPRPYPPVSLRSCAPASSAPTCPAAPSSQLPCNLPRSWQYEASGALAGSCAQRV